MVRATQLAGPSRRALVLVEDLHRIDGASRVAIADALREPPVARVLVVATHVPSFDPSWTDASLVRVLEPVPARVVAQVYGDPALDGFRPRDSFGGFSPMHIDQMHRLRAEGGADRGGRLADVLAQRLAQLEGGARQVLQALSVLGEEANEEDIRALVGRVDWDASVNILVVRSLVHRVERGLRIEHPILREVAYATIPLSARRHLHARAFTRAQGAELPYEVQALHAIASGNSPDALRLLLQVAARAGAAGDLPGQIGALRRGLETARRELLRGELETPGRAIAIFAEKLATALAEVGSFTEAEGVLRETAPQVPQGGREHASIVECLRRIGRARTSRHAPVGAFRDAILAARESGAADLVRELESLGDRVGA
jgi:serine/threonine-protein kinase